MPDLTPKPQSWHEYNRQTSKWEKVPDAGDTIPPLSSGSQADYDPKLTIATWNVDALAIHHNPRLEAILSRLIQQEPAPDVIFLQEVYRKAVVPAILDNDLIREGWFSSEADTTIWGGHQFATITLLSKARFGAPGGAPPCVLGRVSRINFSSRFSRDALCAEVLVPSQQSGTYRRVQLVNVHLDSPSPFVSPTSSRRPHQLFVAAEVLRKAGRGLVAGDFNGVLPEDETLIADNGLSDAWKVVHGDDPGYTWGVDGNEPFPPNRLDRVATLGLEAVEMEVMHPGTIDNQEAGEGAQEKKATPWSDHSGLKCTFIVEE